MWVMLFVPVPALEAAGQVAHGGMQSEESCKNAVGREIIEGIASKASLCFSSSMAHMTAH